MDEKREFERVSIKAKIKGIVNGLKSFDDKDDLNYILLGDYNSSERSELITLLLERAILSQNKLWLDDLKSRIWTFQNEDMPVLNCIERRIRNEIINEERKKFKTEEFDNTIITNQVLSHILKKDMRLATETMVRHILSTEKIYSTRDDDGSEMWIYRDGIYVPDGRSYVKETCRLILGDNFKSSILNEVILKIESDTYIEQEELFQNEDLNKVAIDNGILNLHERELEPFSPEYKFFNKLPVAYNPEYKCPNILKHFKEVLKSEEDLPVLQELFGFLLYREYKVEKAFMFTGSGRNGKGKSLELMKRFLGINNCSNIPIQEFERDSFAKGELFNKLANLGGDLSATALKETGDFKSLTGRDLISAARKFKTRVNFTNYAKLIFCANELPKTSDQSLAFFNRWVMLDFPYTFMSQKEIDCLSNDDKLLVKLADKDIINKMSTPSELSGLLNWALDGLERLLMKGDFSYSISTQQVKDSWLRKSNSVTAFLLSEVVESESKMIKKGTLMEEYFAYCRKHKVMPKGPKEFKEVLMTTYCVGEYRDETSRYWTNINLKYLELNK